MRRLNRPVLVAVVVAALATGACSSSGSKSTAAPGATTTSTAPGRSLGAPTTGAPTAATGTSISIKGFAFEPIELKVKVGDTVTVTNTDGTDHTLSAVDGSFSTGRFSSGTKTFTVDKAGRFEFKCEVHSFMPPGFIQASE